MGKLQFRKAGAAENSNAQGDYFSFDLGGTLLGGTSGGEVFLAECKGFTSPGDQHPEYRKFLANCYRVQSAFAAQYDHFLWITWSPFQISEWRDLLTPTKVTAAVNENTGSRYTALGAGHYEPDVAEAVAAKVIVVVLADRQEIALSLHDPELIQVRQALLGMRSKG